MNFDNIKISAELVPANYLKLAQEAQKWKEKHLTELLEKRKLPEYGWKNEQIEALVQHLANLDSNNFEGRRAGLGEREARIACALVARRHYNFGHGIGRSGDLLEAQPKAAGSTLMSNLTNALLLDLIKIMGVRSCTSCFLVPMATGMTLTLCLLSFKKQRPQGKYVLWSRIDQKSCFKAITTAGLTPIIIDQQMTDNGLVTDVQAFKRKLQKLPSREVLCIYSTSSCFAPRNCDNLVELAQLCQELDIPHLINNAYGLQSTKIMHLIKEAKRLGRVDLFVQSTDKNLMVPVGGAIVAGFDETIVRNVAKTYAGRASSSQTLDVFMTLLSLGKQGYTELVENRYLIFKLLRKSLETLQARLNEKIIHTKDNPISLCFTLKNIQKCLKNGQISQLGAMLYTRGISGVRVIANGDTKTIDGHTFENWGSHHSSSSFPYLTVACALGIDFHEERIFIDKFKSALKKLGIEIDDDKV